MSIYHKVKCTKEEATAFLDRVKAFLREEGLTVHSLKALRSYGGEVRIYSGGTTERKPLRSRRRFIQDNPDGSKLFERHHEPIESLDYTQVFRADDWEGEKEAIRQFFNKGGGK